MKNSLITYPLLHNDEHFLVFDKPIDLPLSAEVPTELGAVEWFSLHHEGKFKAVSKLARRASGVAIIGQKELAPPLIYRYFFIAAIAKQTTKLPCKLLERSADGLALYQLESTIAGEDVVTTLQQTALSPITSPQGRLMLHCGEIETDKQCFSAPLPDSFRFLLDKELLLLQQAATAWERRNALPRLISNSWRPIHRGELQIPVAIDIYNQSLAIAAFSHESSEQIRRELAPICAYLQKKLNWKQVVLRRHATNPHQKKLIHDLITWGDKKAANEAIEHDLHFAIDLNSNQHTGLFLDQRDSRQRVRQIAAGKRVANLFSFTCSFSAAALQGGAEVVFSIDLAASALRRGKKNFAANDLDREGRGKFIEADVCKWLSKQVAKQQADPKQFRPWDLIICDPPVFASAGKGQAFHVEKKWSEMALQIRTILSKDGKALFANNHRAGDSRYYQRELEKHFQEVRPLKPPIDFPKLQGDAEHVRIYFCSL